MVSVLKIWSVSAGFGPDLADVVQTVSTLWCGYLELLNEVCLAFKFWPDGIYISVYLNSH